MLCFLWQSIFYRYQGLVFHLRNQFNQICDVFEYYRVYRGETPDFKLSIHNQIASTVDTSIDFSARYLDDSAILNLEGYYYKVLSVDRSGNGFINS